MREFCEWKLLTKFANDGILEYVDIAFAAKILGNLNGANECCGAFLAYLLLAARNGHICVKVVDGNIFPRLDSTMKNIESTEVKKVFANIVVNGSRLCDHLIGEGSHFPLRRDEECFYLQRCWEEKEFANRELKRIMASGDCFLCVEDVVVNCQDLSEQQLVGVKHIFDNSFTVITGGPGTGKTFLCQKIVEIICNYCSNCRIKIMLMAPTGKAVSNLQSKIFCRANDDVSIEIGTIHKFLHNLRGSFFDADIIFVDESSLINTGLMGRIFAATLSGSKLVLLGDPNQLPPVDTGDFFIDFVKSLSSKCIVELRTSHRTENYELLQFFDCVKCGDSDKAMEIVGNSKSICFIDIPEGDCGVNVVVEFVVDKLREIFGSLSFDIDDYLSFLYNNFCFLSPMRRGKWGADAINEKIFKRIFSAYVPIMVSSNDYDLQLFNGEIGVCDTNSAKIFFKIRNELQAYIDKRRNLRSIPEALVANCSYAYGFSIHKSQGSEFDDVCIIVPDCDEVMFKESFYTAITRARKNVTIMATSKDIVAKVISIAANRMEMIKEM